MTEIFMPKAGMDMKEGRLIRWLKNVGDAVELDEPIMEIETDKITMEAEAPASGILLAKLIGDDTTVPVLQTIGYIGKEGENIPEGAAAPAAVPAPAVSAAEEDEPLEEGITEVFMPKAGMDMKEGRLIRWLKEVGDEVELDEPIMEIETDKITMEAEAPASGVLLAKLVGDDTVVPVLETIGYIGKAGQKVPARKGSKAAAAPVAAAPAAAAPTAKKATSFAGLVAATPMARRLAKEKGIDLAAISVSGPVKVKDVESYVPAPAAASAEPAFPAKKVVSGSREPMHIPLTTTRKAIARNMFNSQHTMAQTSDSVEVDVTDLVNLRKSLVLCKDQLGVKISVNDLLSFAAVKMIATHPMANASFNEDEIITYPYVNLCTAVATDYGLTSPVIHDADTMNLWELARALHDVTKRARDKKLTMDELTGGTFTLTNMGVFPVDNFNPILPAPQSCILGFGRCVEKPAVWNGQICIRTRMVLSVTYDHRVFDGGEVGSIMKTMKEYLENPSLFLEN